jgi:ABC-type bacteriocin/lantibiotic exporter with double-glycine peptidase domain
MRRRLSLFLLILSSLASGADDAAGLWLDVPFVRQQQASACGAAVLSMLMQFWQQHPDGADADAIHRELYAPEASGVYASQMEDYLRRHGFRTVAFTGEWADIDRHLEQGQPLIAALKTGRRDRHYVVIAGIDRARNIVLTNDPARRKLIKQHRAQFEKQWKGAANWTLLAVPDRSTGAR